MTNLLELNPTPGEGEKTCPECREIKPVAAFGKNKAMRDGLQFYCRECIRVRGKADRDAHPERYKRYQKKSYEKNKPKVLAGIKRIRERRCADLLAKLKAGPCMDCGGHFQACAMDFDHRPGEVKLFGFGGSALVRYSLAKTMAEIAKCDLVCSNCHRVRTWKRLKGI